MKINPLRVRENPTKEHGIEEILALSKDRLTFTQNTSQAVLNANVTLIAVGTPSKGNGEADTRYVEIAAQEVAEDLLPGCSYVMVVKSTVPIGTNR